MSHKNLGCAKRSRRRQRRPTAMCSVRLPLYLLASAAVVVSGFQSGGGSTLVRTSTPIRTRAVTPSKRRKNGVDSQNIRRCRELSFPLSYRNLGPDEANPPWWDLNRFFGKKDELALGEKAEPLYYILDEDEDVEDRTVADEEQEVNDKEKLKIERRERRKRLRLVAQWRKDKKKRLKERQKEERAQRKQELKAMKLEKKAARKTTLVYSGRTMTQEEFEEQRARLEYAMRYTDVATLRSVFGTNRNRFWGDLDVERSRKLYRILLPRLLLALYELGYYDPDILAPLAYHTRKAAKQYARERCSVPGRILAMAYDGFRSWRDYGTFNVEGLSWEQLWAKYEQQLLKEKSHAVEGEDGDTQTSAESATIDDDLKARVYLRILERSCVTNDAIDTIVLGEELLAASKKKGDRLQHTKHRYEVQAVAKRLEQEVRRVILEEDNDDEDTGSGSGGKFSSLIPHVVETVINSARQRVSTSLLEIIDDSFLQRAPSPMLPPRPLLPVEFATLQMLMSTRKQLGLRLQTR